MTETAQLVRCPLCGAAVDLSEISRMVTHRGEEQTADLEMDGVGPLHFRIDRDTVTGCTRCAGSAPN